MSTYSINISQPTESISYDDINFIINLLPDNIDNEIRPVDIRDSILSNWNVPSFKETTSTSSNISYIGIDAGNPSDRDNKLKIYFGKREFSNIEIMNNSLLSSDTDIYFFNTKEDSISQLNTKLLLLSGINTSLYSNAPYIQSEVVIGTSGQVLSLDIINPLNDIIINSDYGQVSINDIYYPSISQNSASASTSRVLRYNNGQLYWDDITLNLYNSVGTSSSPLNIFGTPVLVNGSPIEYTNNNQIPIPFYGIGYGRTFNNFPIVEVLREILYPYLPPICKLGINYSVAEFGTFPSISLPYSVTKRTFNVNSTTLSNMLPGSIPPIISTGQVTVTGTAIGVYISNIDTVFQITANDGTQSISASQSLSFVYPYFYGILPTSTINYLGLSNLNKLVSAVGDQTVSLLGNGYIYFIYDNSYPPLNQILDQNNTNITNGFTYSVVTLTSPDWLWASHQFKVYVSMTSSYSFSPPSVNFKFNY